MFPVPETRRADFPLSRRSLLAGAGSSLLLGVGGCAAPAGSRRGAAPTAAEYVISGAHVLSVDPLVGQVAGGHIHVRDGRIVSVSAQLPAPGLPVIDAAGMIAIPGFVDTHWHMWGAVARNMAGETPATGYFPYSRALGTLFNAQDNARGVRLALAEAVHGGLTTVHNWSHNLLTPEYADAELAVHREVGARARFAYGYSRNTKTNEPLPLADVERVQKQHFSGSAPSRGGLLTLGIATRGPEYNSPDICKREWAAARRLGIGITTHLGVTPASAKTQPPDGIAVMRDNDLLGPDVLLVHATNNTRAQFDILARSRTPVSLSPYTELRTGFGIPPINEMLAAGVQVSLSVDTTILAGNADMFAIMKAMQNLVLGRAQNEFAMGADRLLEMATLDGARALGLQDQVGSLSPGKRADIVLVRTDGWNMVPWTEPVRMVVQSAQPQDVDTVIVDGRVLKWAGQLTTINTVRVVADARETIARIRQTEAQPAR